MPTSKEKVQRRKRFLIDIFGGKCVLCGYNKSDVALDFHHLDRETKVAGVNTLCHSNEFKTALEEAKKCVLLCANCHREVHFGEHEDRDLTSLVTYDAEKAAAALERE